jgi:hypothetical protein
MLCAVSRRYGPARGPKLLEYPFYACASKTSNIGRLALNRHSPDIRCVRPLFKRVRSLT